MRQRPQIISNDDLHLPALSAYPVGITALQENSDVYFDYLQHLNGVVFALETREEANGLFDHFIAQGIVTEHIRNERIYDNPGGGWGLRIIGRDECEKLLSLVQWLSLLEQSRTFVSSVSSLFSEVVNLCCPLQGQGEGNIRGHQQLPRQNRMGL